MPRPWRSRTRVSRTGRSPRASGPESSPGRGSESSGSAATLTRRAGSGTGPRRHR